MSLSKKTEQDILTFLKENIIKIMRYEKLILVLDIPSISTPFIYSIRIAELTDDPEDLLEKISSIARKPEGLKLNIDITNRYYTYLEWVETFDQGEEIEYYYSEKNSTGKYLIPGTELVKEQDTPIKIFARMLFGDDNFRAYFDFREVLIKFEHYDRKV